MKGQFLDMKIVMFAPRLIYCSQPNIDPESVSVVGFYRELCAQLTGDCFDDLADPRADAEICFLWLPWLGEQADAIVMPEFRLA